MYQSPFQRKPRATKNAQNRRCRKLKTICGAEKFSRNRNGRPHGADAVKEKFPPEAVVFPNDEQVVKIIKLANEFLLQ